eukprot:TRINITY_DN6999_c0_g1_i1.p1 TRINITY_DN6999_c0_g1~~TRINITY_DN6999_c0_g1_i1.p1  ORF type:complete len:542 (-),score=162.86 TRINITY_DN6999_c0_g1_i1:71-1696(-)
MLSLIGEGHTHILDDFLVSSLSFFDHSVLNKSKPPIHLESLKAKEQSMLKYPGKLATDGKGRVWISDSNNHRILEITRETSEDDSTYQVINVIGEGVEGNLDGDYKHARFNRLQGLVYDDEKLYVCDTENHLLRLVNLKDKTVSTLAGTGKMGEDKVGGGVGTSQILSTPWDVCHDAAANCLYIAMSGTHQIWKYEISSQIAKNISGTGEELNRNNTKMMNAAWAQPSGITLGKDALYIADSESSCIRQIDLKKQSASGLVGGDIDPTNLFAFGDKDGKGRNAKLQHPLGVLYLPTQNQVLVADTYNSKIKVIDVKSATLTTLIGNGTKGFKDGHGDDASFHEPSGFCKLDEQNILVADTNNHVIRLLNLESKAVRTLTIKPPTSQSTSHTDHSERRKKVIQKNRSKATVIPKKEAIKFETDGKITISISLPNDHFKYNFEAPNKFIVLTSDGSSIEIQESLKEGVFVEADVNQIKLVKSIPFHVGKQVETSSLEVYAQIYFCSKSDGVCLPPVAFLFEISLAEDKAADNNWQLEATVSAP